MGNWTQPSIVMDASDDTSPGEFPCCPLCDNEIEEAEPAAVISAHGSKALAHEDCIIRKASEILSVGVEDEG